MVPRHNVYLIIALTISAVIAPVSAYAANSGLDTPTGTTDMPFGIQGSQVMDLTAAGLAISPTSGSTANALTINIAGAAPRVASFASSDGDYTIPITIQNSSVTCGSGGQWGFGVNGSSAPSFLPMAAGSFWIHEDCFGPRLVITPSGLVGIGTSTPAYALEVNGDIRADGWLRTSGTSGWYSDTYGGGWYMGDGTWIRSYGGKPMFEAAGLDTGAPSGIGCNGSLGGGYELQVCGAGTLKLNGGLTFPDGTVQTTAASGHEFGGAYSQVNGAGCYNANPLTGSCSCPAGYSAGQLLSGSEGTGINMYLTFCFK
jgi:Bacterial shufflon protein, N-terminal constant region